MDAADASIAVAIMYAANVVVPRSGEVLRALSLNWSRGTKISSVLATVVVERVLDIASLGLIFLGAVAFADLPDEQSGIYACSSADRGQTWSDHNCCFQVPMRDSCLPQANRWGIPAFCDERTVNF